MPKEFFTACIENNVDISFSNLPTKIDYNEIINEYPRKYPGLHVNYFNL
jgi:hypothetical protein